MGAQLLKGYSVSNEHSAIIDSTKGWKMYNAKKQGSSITVSAFVLDKKKLKKSNKQQIIKRARKEASNLARMRHPNILALTEALIQDDNGAVFVTQKVQNNLYNLLENKTFSQYIQTQLQLKLLLYPLLQAVLFLHNSVKQAHLNISLESIFLTADNKLKLAGFGFNQLIASNQLNQTEELPQDTIYSAPQLKQKKFHKYSDVYSLGKVIQKLVIYMNTTNNNQFKNLLQRTTAVINRIDVSDILASKWLNDPIITTVKTLDKITSYGSKQQIQFMKGLSGVIGDFQKKVITDVMIPKLIDLYKFNHLAASAIYICIDCLKKQIISKEFFKNTIWQPLKVIVNGKQLTAQTIYLLIKEMLFLAKCLGPQAEQCLMPLYLKCFDCPPKLKQLALGLFQNILKRTDIQIVKTKLLPKLFLTLKDPNLEVRKDALKALLAVVYCIDAPTIVGNVIGALQNCRKIGSDGFIHAITNHIFNNLVQGLSSQVIATKILPMYIPYLIDPSLKQQDFISCKTTILNLINRIQKERNRQFQLSTQPTVYYNQTDFNFKAEKVAQTNMQKSYKFLNIVCNNDQNTSLQAQHKMTNQSEISRSSNNQNNIFNQNKEIQSNKNTQNQGYDNKNTSNYNNNFNGNINFNFSPIKFQKQFNFNLVQSSANKKQQLNFNPTVNSYLNVSTNNIYKNYSPDLELFSMSNPIKDNNFYAPPIDIMENQLKNNDRIISNSKITNLTSFDFSYNQKAVQQNFGFTLESKPVIKKIKGPLDKNKTQFQDPYSFTNSPSYIPSNFKNPHSLSSIPPPSYALPKNIQSSNPFAQIQQDTSDLI